MSEWRPKRFWSEARAAEVEGGWTVHLDGRPVRTPAKAPLTVPTLGLAEAIAAEWAAQGEYLRPETMPLTRTANSAIDRLGQIAPAVVEDLAGFGASDLICYRSEGPMELVARQAADWDPLVDWAAGQGAPLVVTTGIVPVAQPAASLDRLRARVAALDPFRLAAFHDLVALSGSLVIALAVLDGWLPAEAGWRASRIDEDWQREQWGPDEEADAVAERRHAAFLEAARFLQRLG